MPEEKKKKKGLFSKMESREDALRVVKEASMGFFGVAGLQAALSFLVGFSILFDAAIFVIGGFLLRQYNSRVAAVVLLLLALGSVGVTFANKAGANLGGGNNIFLALVVLWVAVRAVEATFKLRGRFLAEATSGERLPL